MTGANPHAGPRPEWTEERVAKLKELWDLGMSAAQIAKRLGGITRNTVCGKVSRMGWQGHVRPSHPSRLQAIAGQPKDGKSQVGIDRHRGKGVRPFKSVLAPREPKAPVVKKQHENQRITAKLQMAGISNGAKAPYTPKPETVVSPNRVTIIDLKHSHCRSIDDDGWYCGNPKDDGSSYCFGHRARYSYPMPDRKRSDRQSSYLAKNF